MICQYSCTFRPTNTDQMKNLKYYLEQILDSRNANHIMRFNWGSSDRCKFGVTCDKVIRAKSDFNSLSRDLDELLSIYLEQEDFTNYGEILMKMRGYFPAVYRQFEIEVHKRMT